MPLPTSPLLSPFAPLSSLSVLSTTRLVGALFTHPLSPYFFRPSPFSAFVSIQSKNRSLARSTGKRHPLFCVCTVLLPLSILRKCFCVRMVQIIAAEFDGRFGFPTSFFLSTFFRNQFSLQRLGFKAFTNDKNWLDLGCRVITIMEMSQLNGHSLLKQI